jgi:hypothetical protein
MWVSLFPRTADAGVAKISFEVGHILRNFYDKSHEKYLLMAV